MSKYESMSDFEINNNVYKFIGEFSKALPDYCNDWKRAGAIISEYKISLINIKNTTMWMACNNAGFETICMSPDGTDDGVSCFDADSSTHNTNPLKAAMIVLLMTRDNNINKL